MRTDCALIPATFGEPIRPWEVAVKLLRIVKWSIMALIRAFPDRPAVRKVPQLSPLALWPNVFASQLHIV